jgi:predicted Zn-dependent peptidase
LIKNCIIFCLCLIFFSCNTIHYSSLFKNNPGKQNIIIKEIVNKINYQEEITLKNNFKVLLKENENKNVKFSLYLKNPLLYQTQLNAGIEKIILVYIKNILFDKFKNRLRYKNIPEITITSNKDFSSLSFYSEKENIKSALSAFAESLKITSFNSIDINKIRDEQYVYLSKLQSDNDFSLDSRSERHIFKSSPIQIPYEGNSISLKILNNNEISNYYKNYFNTNRILLFINGNITKKDFLISDFNLYENLFLNSNISNPVYEKFESKLFIVPPIYYTKQKSDNFSYFESIYNTPSFLNDDYFAFLIANKILYDNFIMCSDIENRPVFSPQMVNMTNYGKLIFKSEEKNTENVLLSFKKVLDITKKGIGVFYYWKDSQSNITKNYNEQDEDKIIIKNISSVIDSYKKELFENFNFTNINTLEKEQNFISIYFLLNQIIDTAVIKDRIDSISENDIKNMFQKYFNNFAWSILSSDKTLKNLSTDFF